MRFLFLAIEILSAALALYVMARIFAALGLFNVLFHAQTVGSQGVLIFSVVLPAALVLLYVLLGGLGATMYAQVMQFFVLVAGFLPMVLLGLKQTGGWSAMKSSFAAAMTHATGSAPASGSIGARAGRRSWHRAHRRLLVHGLEPAANRHGCRRMPAPHAALRSSPPQQKYFFPFLLIVPGVIAMGLPTPHTTRWCATKTAPSITRSTWFPQPPSRVRAWFRRAPTPSPIRLGGKILHDAHGHPLLNYAMATPNLLPYNLPTGLIGLAITALLACLTGGVAARISAIGTIFTCDLYEPRLRKADREKHSIAVARWTTLAAVVRVSSAGLPGDARSHARPARSARAFVCGLLRAHAGHVSAGHVLEAHHRARRIRRTDGRLCRGACALRAHAAAGRSARHCGRMDHGRAHHPAHGFLAQNAGTALCGILANLFVTAIVSLFTAARPEAELTGLVYSLTPMRKQAGALQPELAGIILLAAIAVSLIFS